MYLAAATGARICINHAAQIGIDADLVDDRQPAKPKMAAPA
jgi:hypothetical protein